MENHLPVKWRRVHETVIYKAEEGASLGFLMNVVEQVCLMGKHALLSKEMSVSHMEKQAGFNIWEAFQAVPASNSPPVWFSLTS